MRLMGFGNGKYWRVSEGVLIEGTVVVPGFDDVLCLDERNDMLSEAVTGSTCGLLDIGIECLGGDYVRFSGVISDDFCDDGEVMEVDHTEIDFKAHLRSQYGFSDIEAAHAESSIANFYAEECRLPLLGSSREFRCPSWPAECGYVRVVAAGFEVGYWTDSEFEIGGEAAHVLGALLGCGRGSKLSD